MYLAALGAQFAVDLVVVGVGSSLGHGIGLRTMFQFIIWVFAVDAALAPTGLALAFAAAASSSAVVFCLPLVALLLHFSRERKRRIDHALELSDAYRGTAFLLGDVVEADDAYTGSHSRHVVDLVLGRVRPPRPRRGRPPRQRVRGAAPRRREDPDSRRDHPEARPARRRGARR